MSQNYNKPTLYSLSEGEEGMNPNGVIVAGLVLLLYIRFC
jgi:hypothetical protein